MAMDFVIWSLKFVRVQFFDERTKLKIFNEIQVLAD